MNNKDVVRSGLFDWITQRVTAVILGLYIISIGVFWMLVPVRNSFVAWQHFLLSPAMRLGGGLASLSMLIHATIGLWTIATDYLPKNSLRTWVLTLGYLSSVICSAWIMVILIGDVD